MLVLILLAGIHFGDAARGDQITGIVSFGDSLSDVGNAYLGSGKTQPEPVSAYYQGHFSNGPIWLEYLAKNLGVAAPTPSLAGGTDYAFGGAQTGNGYANLAGFQVPNIGTQIGMYLAHNTPSPTELYTVWGGANDVLFGSQPNPASSVANIGQEITTLAAAGAKQFLVPNLPPLDKIPDASSLTPAQQQGLALFTQAYNQGLQSEATYLEKSLGVQVHILDINSLVNSVLANPSHYGFTDVTDAALLSGSDGKGYLFWDPYHPTTQAGAIIGGIAAQSVPEPSTLLILATTFGAAGLVHAARRWRGH
jgi:phospholipase/lecithinase/hemolysin